MTTGFGVINNNAQLKIGQSIAIFGAGGIGLNIVQAAALVSANPIIAVDLFDNRLALARSLGATHLINSAQARRRGRDPQDRRPAGRRRGRGQHGQRQGDRDGLPPDRCRAGRTVLVGVPPKESAAAIYTLPLHFEKTLTGSHGGECRPERRYSQLRPPLLRRASCNLRPLIGKRYRLAEINQAIARHAQRRTRRPGRRPHRDDE